MISPTLSDIAQSSKMIAQAALLSLVAALVPIVEAKKSIGKSSGKSKLGVGVIVAIAIVAGESKNCLS